MVDPYRSTVTLPHVSDTLDVADHTDLPRRCLKCGAQKNLVHGKRVLEHTPFWVPATLFIVSPLVMWVLYRLLRKRGTLTFSLCRTCDGGWMNARTAQSVIAIGCCVGGVAVLALLFNDLFVASGVLALGLGAGVLWTRQRFILGQTFAIVEARRGRLVIGGVHPDVIRELTQRGDSPTSAAG